MVATTFFINRIIGNADCNLSNQFTDTGTDNFWFDNIVEGCEGGPGNGGNSMLLFIILACVVMTAVVAIIVVMRRK